MKSGLNCIVSNNSDIGKDVVLGHNVIIENNVHIGEGTFIDSNCIIRAGAYIGNGSFIQSNCIIGEYQMDYCLDRQYHDHPLHIGNHALIRSGSIIYSGSEIGDNFNTGHQVTIREKARIGNNVSIGTLSDIQGNCEIGNYVRMHSNVHIGQLSKIDDYVWIFPYVVLTNDPTPPSEEFVGVHIKSFAIVSTGSLIMPGKTIESDSLVGAGAIVTKDVPQYAVVVGNPGKVVGDVRNIKNKFTGESVYPWRYHFTKYMPWEDSDYDTWYNTLNISK